MPRTALIACCLLSWSCASNQPGDPGGEVGAVERWGVAEIELRSDRIYEHPLWDAQVAAEFTSPTGAVVRREAFWDGDRRWLVRFCPTEAGDWSWRTTCTPGDDRGLHDRRGALRVVPPPASPRTVRRGPLALSADRTHLVHADGSPFFWLGDTAWNGALRSTPREWEEYLDRRAEQGFNVIQFVTTQWRGGTRSIRGPVFIPGPRLGVNVDYLRELDARFQAVQRRGMVAAPVMLWALKPDDPGQALSEPDAIRLARYQVARWGAYSVVWFLGGDGTYSKHPGGGNERWKRIGRAVFGDAHDRLATLHPSGQSWIGDDFAAEPWFDFAGYQSGHGCSDTALKWLTEGPVAARWNKLSPARPVINLEPNYEGHPCYQNKSTFTDHEVRRASYWSLLITPPAGVTYGNNPVWVWASQVEDAENHANLRQIGPWRDGLNMPGVQSMTILRRFFESGPWTALRPAPQLLAEQRGDWAADQFVAVAATPDHRWMVAYLPRGRSIRLNTQALPTGSVAQWFNPRDGSGIDAGPIAPGIQPFTAPDDSDWVLSIRSRPQQTGSR